MMQKADGMNYAPVSTGKVEKVNDGSFRFSVIGLDHGHVYAMTNGLLEAGATLVGVHGDESKMDDFLSRYSAAKRMSEDEILSDDSISLVVSAIRPDKRAPLGIKVMRAGKDFFVDKPGMLKLEEVDEVEKTVKETGRRYWIYFGERIHVEGAVYAEKLIADGALGRIISITILAPHRLNASTRPDWFFDPDKNGGIISDIGSHQIEQFLTYSGAKTAKITHSLVGNYANPAHPRFLDYGEVSLLTDNNVAGTFRVDWFTPSGLSAWGDGRVFIVGTKATLEIRKYIDVATSSEGDQLYLVDGEGEHHIRANGKTGFPFFGRLINDSIERTENAISQAHTLEAMRITIKAENSAYKVEETI